MDPRTLLVVDNDPCACENLGEVLSGIGYRPIFSSSLSGALDALRGGDSCEAILLDESLAHKEGQYMIAGLRELGFDQPVVIMSPMADQLLVDWIGRGASDIIKKPTPPRRLKELLRSACARQGH